MVIKKDTLDQLLAGRDPRDVFAKDGLVDELKKALAERVLTRSWTITLTARRRRASQPAQRLFEEDGADRESKLELAIPRDREGTFDPQADRQVPAPLSRLRRQDHLDVRARHEGPGDPGPFARDLRPRRLARPDLDGHRRGAGDGARVAEPAAGDELPAGLLRRHAGQDPRRGPGPQQGGLSGARRPGRRHARTFWASGSRRPRAPSSGCGS